MTVMLRKPAREGLVWSTMPGWGIAADLTPPELVAARTLKMLRRVIAGVIAMVIVLCGVGVYLAQGSESSANEQLTAVSNQTTALNADRLKYAKVTQVEAAIASAKGQASSLMSSDVDIAKLVNDLARATPKSVVPTSISLSLSSVAGATTPAATSGGVATIGTVTMNGYATKLDDMADFVTALTATSGIVNVVPTTNTRSTASRTSWTLTFQLTTARYSNRFTAGSSAATSKPGGS